MTYHREPGNGRIGMQNEPRLAEKLRREYRGRGEDLRGVHAASTEELMHRATMGRDPRVNVSEEAFEERLHARDWNYARPAGRPIYSAQRRAGYTRAAGQNPAGQGTSRPYSAQQTSRQTARRAGGKKNVPKAAVLEETTVQGRALPPFFILLLTFMTVMVLLIVFSIAQIYKTTDEIGDLKTQLSTLQTTAAELELKIEEKNDIRTIEKIATEELGMVKEDSVQKKYVSLSDGERIDLVEEPQTDTEEGLGTMLSSIFSALGKWFGGDDASAD